MLSVREADAEGKYPPVVLISDLEMPDCDGEEVGRKVGEMLEGTPEGRERTVVTVLCSAQCSDVSVMCLSLYI